MASETQLGGTFWIFQSGQMISIVGDSCGTIALAWWILGVTGSPGAISTVLAPALIVQTGLIPLLGPMGDRFSRKHLILGADLFRGLMIGVLALMAAHQAFSLHLVAGVYLFFAAGSALFKSNNMSIVPQLVSPEALTGAVRVNQSFEAVGRVLGGIVAGFLVTRMGVASAFVADAASFGVAALATVAVLGAPLGGASTVPAGEAPSARPFIRQLRGGFRVVHRVPLLFRLCIALACFNFVLNPMQVLLPAYAKQAKGMPAWFLGGLESSVGAGIILGAVCIGPLERRPRLISSVVIGLMFIGSSMIFLPHTPGVIFPMGMMFLLGIGAAWTNIPIGTRISVALPDHFRSRVSSIIAFLCDSTGPLGIALGGLLAAGFGVTWSITGLGAAVLALLPAVLLIPDFAPFFRRSAAELTGHFLNSYPHAFEEDG